MSAMPEAPRPFRLCALVPTYDNPDTIRRVAERLRAHDLDVLVIDDGSAAAGREAVAALARDGLARVRHRDRNGGKGAAVKTGLRFAVELGYTHALQIDADGQHALEDVPRFCALAATHPDAVILGAPVFDETAPAARRFGRRFTQMWTNLETFGRVVHDPMCGFRVYPVQAAVLADAWGDAMDFDPEIAVRLVWRGLPVMNVPTRVRFLTRSVGGVSLFRMFRDNALISWMHTRLVVGAILRLLTGRARRREALLP